MSADRTLQSRPADPEHAKCTERLDIPLPPELKEAISALATIDGTTAAGYVRRVLDMHVYGRLDVTRRIVGRSNG